jgi:hypothetical protein
MYYPTGGMLIFYIMLDKKYTVSLLFYNKYTDGILKTAGCCSDR